MHFLAYIDPGTGALLWQSLAAGVVGFFFYLKKTRQWFMAVFRKIFQPEKPRTPRQPPDHDPE